MRKTGVLLGSLTILLAVMLNGFFAHQNRRVYTQKKEVQVEEEQREKTKEEEAKQIREETGEKYKEKRREAKQIREVTGKEYKEKSRKTGVIMQVKKQVLHEVELAGKKELMYGYVLQKDKKELLVYVLAEKQGLKEKTEVEVTYVEYENEKGEEVTIVVSMVEPS